MNDDDLINIWEENKQDSLSTNQKITKDMIENYLKPKVSNVHLSFNISIVVTLAAFIASIIVFSINTYVFRANPRMFYIELLFLVLSLLFLFYGVFIFVKLREINNFSRSLIDLLNSKISFIKSHYEIWLVILSVGMMMLVFGVNSLVDSKEGTYQINNLGSYLLVNLFVFLFVYIINKYSAFASVQKMKLYLSDLQSESIENSIKDEKIDKKRMWAFYTVAIVIVIAIILGILKLISFI